MHAPCMGCQGRPYKPFTSSVVHVKKISLQNHLYKLAFPKTLPHPQPPQKPRWMNPAPNGKLFYLTVELQFHKTQSQGYQNPSKLIVSQRLLFARQDAILVGVCLRGKKKDHLGFQLQWGRTNNNTDDDNNNNNNTSMKQGEEASPPVLMGSSNKMDVCLEKSLVWRLVHFAKQGYIAMTICKAHGQLGSGFGLLLDLWV